MAYTIALINPKGGAGKSTTAVHLARAIQLAGSSVVLLDLEATGMSLASAWFDRTELDVFSVEPASTMKKVRSRIRYHQDKEYVVIDSAAGQTDMGVAAAYVSRLVIIPTFPDLQTLEPAMKAYWDLNAVRENTGMPMEIRLLICRAERNTRLLSMTIEALEDYPMFETILYKYQLYPWAITNGSTVLDMEVDSPASRQFLQLVDEIKEVERGTDHG